MKHNFIKGSSLSKSFSRFGSRDRSKIISREMMDETDTTLIPSTSAKIIFFITGFLIIVLMADLAKAAISASAKLNQAVTNSNNISNKKQTVVAVIDTGADINHRDLKQAIWTNPGESGFDANGRGKSSNGIDDDGNGFVDDVHGWNFVDDNNKVLDSEGHGTHVAGIIKHEFEKNETKASKNFQRSPAGGFAEQSADLKLMILKYYSSKSRNEVNVINTIRALRYATKMKVQIINYSAGGGVPDYFELQAIKNARAVGIIMVVAAGNEQSNNDVNQYYPASYRLDNIVSVAAVQNNGKLTSFSNYGQNTIDIAAPGKSIYSTLPNNSYGVLSGTSQATAFVTGYLASLMNSDYNQGFYKSEIQSLLKKAVYNKNLKGRTKYQLALADTIEN